MGDRTVHAILTTGHEIVRYNRAGKWYSEKWGELRYPLTLEEAVLSVTHPKDQVFYGLPGGRRFDAAVKQRRAGK